MVITRDFILTTPNLYCAVVAANIYGCPRQTDMRLTYVLPRITLKMCSKWCSEKMFHEMRNVPQQLELDLSQGFVNCPDPLIIRILELAQKHGRCLNDRVKAMLYLVNQILYFRSKDSRSFILGYVEGERELANACGVTLLIASQAIDDLLNAKIIYRKWLGNNLMCKGSCYLLCEEFAI